MRMSQLLQFALFFTTNGIAGCMANTSVEPVSTRRDEPVVRPASAAPPANTISRPVDERGRSARSGLKYSVAYPTGVRESSVLLLEADAPDEARVKSTFSYTLRVTNLTDNPLHNVSVYDPDHVPAVTRAVAEADGAAPAPTRPSAHAMSSAWDVGTLGPRESKSRQVSVTADEVGALRTCLAASYTPTLCTAVRITKPELKMSLEGPTDVLICEPITRRYVVTNTGTGTADAVKIADELPEGLVTQDDQRRVSLTLGDVRPGETKSMSVALKATRTGDFASRASAASGDDVRADAAVLTTAVREPVLAVSIVSPESRYADEPIDYRVTVRNTGDGPARRTVLKLAASGVDVDARLPDRDLGTIAPGQSVTQNVPLRAPHTGGKVSLNATVNAQCAQTAGAGAAVQILTVPALLLECNDSTDPVRVGNSTVYTITVTNQGTGADANVKLRITVPDEERYVDGHGATPIQAAGQILTTDPVVTLAPKQAVQWKVECRGAKAGDARFNVELTSDSLTRPATKSESTRVVGEAADVDPVPPATTRER